MLSAVVHRHPLSGHEGVDALLGDAREVAAVIEVLDLIEMMVVMKKMMMIHDDEEMMMVMIMMMMMIVMVIMKR